jgi:carbonic anhydrase
MANIDALTRLNEGCKCKRTAAAEGQCPFAAILCCSDSRVPPERVFDCGAGEIFVVRTAGNVADAVAIGSIEYAVKHLGAELVLVMGHNHCGAVEAKAAGLDLGSYMDSIMDLILPDVKDNVLNTIQTLRKSPVLSALEKGGTLKMAGAVYTLETGEVEFIRQQLP